MNKNAMNTVFVKKQVNCKFGVSLFPNKPYQAKKDDYGRWLVQVSPAVWVGVLPSVVTRVAPAAPVGN